MDDALLTPSLTVLTGAMRGTRLRLPLGTHVIGRGPEATVLIDDHRISRRHAAIRLAPQEAFLVDLGSTNGTWCNGQPVGAETRLADGDRIRLGLVEVRYCDPAAADTVPVNDFRNLPLLSRTLHRRVLVPGGAGIPQVRTPAPVHTDRSVTAPIDEPVPAADH
ncbi:FHA domain-containing protein [Micromonosporaceae bacterium DT55]|uniref:FHA domain-containing protein n=1 Tax=Melissospora conviva TaxID=3388432 RepID=UPI003C1F5F78